MQTGDVVVVMSDGFPEMFNLVEIGGTWAGARPADDDVTFVVLKIS